MSSGTFGFPQLVNFRPLTVTNFSNASVLVTASFTGSNPEGLRLELGDLVTINYSVSGNRNAADFSYKIVVRTNGTAICPFSEDSSSSSQAIVAFSGITAVFTNETTATFNFRCTTAGFMTSAGATSVAITGTAVTLPTSSVRVVVQRNTTLI